MRIILLVAIVVLTASRAFSQPKGLTELRASEAAVRADLREILRDVNYPVDFKVEAAAENSAKILCAGNAFTIQIRGDHRWSQTFYMALQRLGFLFPHPRMQISPSLKDVQKQCGKVYFWSPAVQYSGFHLHTLHPSEWVHGFLMGKEEIALQTVRWLARNQQNVFDLSLLDEVDRVDLAKRLSGPFSLARELGIHPGVALGFALNQQNSYKLIGILASFFDGWSNDNLEDELNWLIDNVRPSFVNLEPGTSEFTPTNYERSLAWMNRAVEIAEDKGVRVFVKIHTSSNQKNEKWGNFNFLPRHADPRVGILPHTVYLYSLDQENAPMYGNPNFHYMRDFMIEENSKRSTWFYPETSYFCALDLDVPLLLTDYLLTRAQDTKLLFDKNIQGQLNFSTGQELGYWLMDWTFTLLNNRDYEFDPMIGLKLLGEDAKEWKKIVDFQHRQFVRNGVINIVTGIEFGTELLPEFHQTLAKNSMKNLSVRPGLLTNEINLLAEAKSKKPGDVRIRNPELKALWEITSLRIDHALEVRLALQAEATRDSHLANAVKIRLEAQKKIDFLRSEYQRYREAALFDRQENPTSYPYGYAYAASNLHYWLREEEMVRTNNYSPFFMSLLSVWDVISGPVL